MGYQFAHVETYSRSGSRGGGHTVRDIIAEAQRSPESCLHVATPRPPVLVTGCGLEELERRHDDLVASAKETLANGKQRSVRKDTCSLFTIVLSHPATPGECRADPATMTAVKDWARDSAKWLGRDLEARGGVLETVVMHVDESHVHLHAYGLHPSGHADRLHPGKVAKRAAVDAVLEAGQDRKTANAVGDKAYVTAMRNWQDFYSHDVGLPHGLTRLGPARRRLSRAEWQAEKAAARSVRQAKAQAKAAVEEANMADADRRRMLASTRSEADALMDAAKATAMKVERHAATVVRKAQRERGRILSRARRDLGRLRSIGIMMRTFWDSLRISTLRRAVRQELQELVDRQAGRAAEALRRLRDESRRRLAAEARLADAILSARTLGRERDEIRRQRDRLLGEAAVADSWNRPKFP
jgi:hypothetical protein